MIARRARVVLALAFVAAIALSGVVAPWLSDFDPVRPLDIAALKNAAPGTQHPLGTDPFSRDVWSRVLHGTRTSLTIGVVGAGLALLIAIIIGAATATTVRGGVVLLTIVDALRAIPRKLLLLAALLLLPHPGALSLALLIGVLSWTGLAQIVHTRLRGVLAQDFVTGARALGVAPGRLMLRHLLPHLVPPLGAAGALLVSDILAVEAGLTFLGLGIRPPTPSWGAMLQDGVPYLATAWWVTAAPAAFLVTTVLSLALLADSLDAADEDGSTTLPSRRRSRDG